MNQFLERVVVKVIFLSMARFEQYESPWVVPPGDAKKMWSELRSKEIRFAIVKQNQQCRSADTQRLQLEDNVTIIGED